MIAFVHIEKCGGTTLVHLLRQAFAYDHCDVIPSDTNSMSFSKSDMSRLLKLRPSTLSISGHSLHYQELLHSECDIDYYTILRDPIKRYVSDYRHLGKNFLLKGDTSFEKWLDLESRHNFQTRRIAGSDNPALAKHLLTNNFSVVGILEEYKLFLAQLRSLVLNKLGISLPQVVKAKNVRSNDQQAKEEECLLLDKYEQEIKEVNKSDIQLYESMKLRRKKELSIPESSAEVEQKTTLRFPISRMPTTAAWLYRNLVYKPHVGRIPFVPHVLPIYAGADNLPMEKKEVA